MLKSAVVSQECDGSYYCSCLYEYEDNISAHKVTYENTIGLDYKSDGLYVSSEGETCGSPKYYRKSQKKLAKLQRKLKNKVLHSSNYNKQQHKISKLHRHIANQRADFLHKKSYEIANRYELVCVENINLKNMSNKDFGNGKATSDNGFGMFLNMLGYKLSNLGKTLIKVDKYYPSSQLCSCGYQNPITKNLNIRIIKCPVCHKVYDRDVNAAINIKNEGYRLYLQTVI